MESGSLIGQKYRLKQKIGDGATCEVWEAAHAQTARAVAIKLILRSTEVFRHRLLREARICGEISHRNVIEVLDAGQLDNGDPYLVMPLLQGETLAALLERQFRLDVAMAAQIGRDVARALGAAHAKSIIHRDLKPANIFLHNEPGGEGAVVKVLDFGIGKNLSVEESVATVVGGLMGSPAYMSPEQVRCDPNVDHQTDIWSLGVVLFEMLTGKRPFEGSSAAEVVAKIARGEVPKLSRFVRNVDASLEALVWHCMQVDRERRAKSAGDIAKILDGFTSAGESSRVMTELPSRDGLSSPGLGGERRSSVEISAVLGQGAGAEDATLKFGPAHLAGRESSAPGFVPQGTTEKLDPSHFMGMARGGAAGARGTMRMANDARLTSPVLNAGPRGTMKLESQAKEEARAGLGSGSWAAPVATGGAVDTGIGAVGVTTSVPASMAAPVAPVSGPGMMSLDGGARVSGMPYSGDGRYMGAGGEEAERTKKLKMAVIAGVGAALAVVVLGLAGFSLIRGSGAGKEAPVDAGVEAGAVGSGEAPKPMVEPTGMGSADAAMPTPTVETKAARPPPAPRPPPVTQTGAVPTETATRMGPIFGMDDGPAVPAATVPNGGPAKRKCTKLIKTNCISDPKGL